MTNDNTDLVEEARTALQPLIDGSDLPDGKKGWWSADTLATETFFFHRHEAEFLAKAPTYVKKLADALEASGAENARVLDIIDRHLPTILTGLQHIVYQDLHKDKEDLTDDDIALRAALSAAHWIAKDIMTRNGKALYDLPSVLDLLETQRRAVAEREEWHRRYLEMMQQSNEHADRANAAEAKLSVAKAAWVEAVPFEQYAWDDLMKLGRALNGEPDPAVEEEKP